MNNMSFLIWINCPLVWITAKNGMHFKFTRHAKEYKGMLITTAKGKRIYPSVNGMIFKILNRINRF